jgi:hypothetical protein
MNMENYVESTIHSASKTLDSRFKSLFLRTSFTMSELSRRKKSMNRAKMSRNIFLKFPPRSPDLFQFVDIVDITFEIKHTTLNYGC